MFIGQTLKGNETNIYPRICVIIEIPGFYPNLIDTENLNIFVKLRGNVSKNNIKQAFEIVGFSYNDKNYSQNIY